MLDWFLVPSRTLSGSAQLLQAAARSAGLVSLEPSTPLELKTEGFRVLIDAAAADDGAWLDLPGDRHFCW